MPKTRRGGRRALSTGKVMRDQLHETSSTQTQITQIMTDTGYSEEEAKELLDTLSDYFSGNYSDFVNGKRPQDVQRIEDGIDKMPGYDGSVYRGMAMDDASEFASLKPGDPIQMKSISSWSSKDLVANRFGKMDSPSQDSVIMTVKKNKSGVGIQHLSELGNSEAEVLVPSKAKYKVVSTKTQNKYDYLMENYNKLLSQIKNPFSRTTYQNKLNVVKNNKDLFKNRSITILELKEV